MASKAASVRKAILERFDTEWADALPVRWPNVEFDPPNDGEWVAIDIVGGAGSRLSAGLDRMRGQVILSVYVQPGSGDGDAYGHADSLRDIFRGWEDDTLGLTFHVPSMPRPALSGGGPESAKWIVNCPFEVRETV